MAFLPLIFVILPTIELLPSRPRSAAPSSIPASGCPCCTCSSSRRSCHLPSPPTPSSANANRAPSSRFSSPLIRREEFLVGKALAVLVPTLAIAYLVFGIFLGIAAIFAHPGVASAVFERSHLLVQLLFTPLLAGWSIWVGIAISARSVDVRAAQQLGTLASLPPLAIVALMSFNVITPTLGLALGLAAALLIVDVLGWRAVAAMFDRERLITGTRS